jgi:hypothetical protein
MSKIDQAGDRLSNIILAADNLSKWCDTETKELDQSISASHRRSEGLIQVVCGMLIQLVKHKLEYQIAVVSEKLQLVMYGKDRTGDWMREAYGIK